VKIMFYTLKKLFLWLFIFLSMFNYSILSFANSQSSLERIKSSGVLKFPVMQNQEPGYIYDEKTQLWRGFYIEWGKSLAKSLDVKLQLVPTNWGNIAQALQQNQIDVAIGLNPNLKRAQLIDHVPTPLFTDAWAILARPNSDKQTWSDLNHSQLRVAVEKNTSMQSVAEIMLPKAKIMTVDDRTQAVNLIQSQQADALILSIFDVAYLKNTTNLKMLLPQPILYNPAFIGIKRESGNHELSQFLMMWVYQQRSLGLAQAQLSQAFNEAKLDLSALPKNFHF
jgi:polar amino acid transport system substrate-binding protein